MIPSQSMLFAAYKPIGPSSNQLLNKIRKIAGTKKVGHAGTLDPLAQGVLVVAINKPSTKQLAEIVQKEKEYIAKIYLGKTSTTDDEEGEKSEGNKDIIPTREDIENVLPDFTGDIMQVPPIFSALKVKGQRAYKLAREGKEVKLDARPAFIKEIEILDYSYPEITVRFITGKGVYIRSLARDIGKALGTGAYMSALERIRVGQFKKEDSISEKALESYIKKNYRP